MGEVRVHTQVYTGPLDLLLYLCRRAEVDIYDLPVAEIAEQYINELEKMETIDLEYAGEFLTMAANLLKLKSELVLARSEERAEAENERARLVRQLLEYKRIRDMATLLDENWLRQARRRGRPGGQLQADTPESDNDTYLEDFSVVDLYRVFHRLYGEVAAPTPHLVDLTEKPVRYYIDLILAQLKEHGKVDFAALVGPQREKTDLIGNFLALLEMVKQHEISIEQNEAGEITIGPPIDYGEQEPGAQATGEASEEE
ncbi:MAG: segregation/condensation protein A [Planctomycetes bacterium]|nr:segregation/condensation protein A [Planctomycetota bacterium]